MICQDRNQEGGIFYTGKAKTEFPALQDFFFLFSPPAVLMLDFSGAEAM